MIDRVRVVGEELVAAISVQSRRWRTRDRIGKRIGIDDVTGAIGVVDRQRMLHRGH